MSPEPSEAGPTRRRVEIPPELWAAIESRLRGTAFRSVEEFVTFVLARVAERPAGTPFSAEEEEELRGRLRSLGYID